MFEWSDVVEFGICAGEWRSRARDKIRLRATQATGSLEEDTPAHWLLVVYEKDGICLEGDMDIAL
jgi:hypothetical protein